MCFGPVMNCDYLSMEEKLLLNYIMSLKYSFDNVKVRKDTAIRITGLNSDQYDSAVYGLEKKRLLFRAEGVWLLDAENINSITDEYVYDLAEFYGGEPGDKDDILVEIEKSIMGDDYHYLEEFDARRRSKR